MEKSYLIKRKSLLLAGIKEEANVDNIIAFDNMAIELAGQETDPKNVILLTKDRVKEEISFSILTAHKQIVGEVEASTDTESQSIIDDYNNGLDITFKSTFEADGSNIYNKTKAAKGDIIFFIKRNPSDSFKPEEAIILSDLSMDLLSSTNADDIRLLTVEAEQKDHETRIKAREDEDADILKVTNDKFVTGHGVLGLTGTVVEGDKLARRDEIASPLNKLKQEADANKVEADATKVVADNAHDQLELNTPAIATNSQAIVTNSNAIAANLNSATQNANAIATNIIDIADNKKLSTQNETDITTEEAATDLIRTRLDALEAEGNVGKKVFDTGEVVNGIEQPKKFYQQFPALTDDTTLNLLTIPATAMDGGVAYDAKDFEIDPTSGNGPEVQIVVWGDESLPTNDLTLPLETAPEADWEGTQSFTTIQAGRTWVHLGTSHWSAQFKVSDKGLITMKDFQVMKDSTGTDYPVKRLILVQASLDLSQAIIGAQPYYSKTESDSQFTTKTETAALDARVATNTGAISVNKATAITNAAGNATNSKDIAANTVIIGGNTAKGIANAASIVSGDAKIAANTKAIDAKQSALDTSLATNSKGIVGAINELKTLSDTTRNTQAQIGDKPVSDGEHILDTAETLATEKWVTASQALQDAKITANEGNLAVHWTAIQKNVPTESITLTYDDGSTEIIKVGK